MTNEKTQINQAAAINSQSPSRADIRNRIERAESVLAKLRIFPADWVSESGETKAATEARLEECIENLQAMLDYTYDSPAPAKNSTLYNEETQSMQFIANQQSADQAALLQRIHDKFYEVNGVYIPVVQSSLSAESGWQAITAKTMLSGGVKCSEVQFVKDANGLTTRAKPSEKMDFNERTQDKRLPYIDTILQGTAEIKGFNLIYQTFAKAENDQAKAQSFTKANYIKTLLPDSIAQNLPDLADFADRVAEIFRTLLYLRDMDDSGTEFIPSPDISYKLTPFIKEKLAEFAGLINRQLGLPTNEYLKDTLLNKDWQNMENSAAQGMTIIVGPRGSGKNKLVEHYATIANRPLFRYVCSPDKEERDLTYDIELADGEVIKVPTRILTAISTPNAILELDEINLLRPSVAKFFNALFDSDRSVFLSDHVIHATKGVVFVGLMNPADYNGVEDLPETIDDRSNTMALGYPPLKEINPNNGQEFFTHDEALILRNNIAPLQEYTDEQFIQLWNRVINGSGTVNAPLETARIIRDLKNIILIAHRTRQTVEACKTRSGNVQMKRDISLRGTISATTFYSENRLWEADLHQMPGWRAPWTAAQYAVAMTYLPHTETYRKGQQDKQAFEAILTEGLSV